MASASPSPDPGSTGLHLSSTSPHRPSPRTRAPLHPRHLASITPSLRSRAPASRVFSLASLRSPPLHAPPPSRLTAAPCASTSRPLRLPVHASLPSTFCTASTRRRFVRLTSPPSPSRHAHAPLHHRDSDSSLSPRPAPSSFVPRHLAVASHVRPTFATSRVVFVLRPLHSSSPLRHRQRRPHLDPLCTRHLVVLLCLPSRAPCSHAAAQFKKEEKSITLYIKRGVAQ